LDSDHPERSEPQVVVAEVAVAGRAVEATRAIVEDRTVDEAESDRAAIDRHLRDAQMAGPRVRTDVDRDRGPGIERDPGGRDALLDTAIQRQQHRHVEPV